MIVDSWARPSRLISEFGGNIAVLTSARPVSEPLRDWSIAVHFYAAYGVFFLALLHAGAALKHQFVDRRGTLRRRL
jgi:cytochrome b561